MLPIPLFRLGCGWPSACCASGLEVDIRLLLALDTIELNDQDGSTGGGLNRTFWNAGGLPSADRVCLCGDVPVDLDPKAIVERVASLN